MTFGGLPTRWEPTGPSRGLAIVAPGRAYSPSAPLLELARLALLQHGFTVQQVWWDSTTRGDEDPEPWVRRHVVAALSEEDADRVLVVGKSLGTRAASYAAETRELADNGCDVLEVPDADHSMAVPDEVVRTAEIHLEVARALEAHLSQS